MWFNCDRVETFVNIPCSTEISSVGTKCIPNFAVESNKTGYVGIFGLVGRATAFIGGDMGSIPTGSAHDRGVAVDLSSVMKLLYGTNLFMM